MVTTSSSSPLGDVDMQRLQALLDALPAPLEPLDVVMTDGYLCGVLLQPARVPEALWLPGVLDADGRPAPAGVDAALLADLLRRRHAELERAIDTRQWFDPWVYEMDDDASAADTVLPWVAGFAAAMDRFPAASEAGDAALLEPMALLYQYLDPEDLEDADELLAEIETMEPATDLADAVEDLVRAVLLWADVTRPRPASAGRAGPARGPHSRSGRPAPRGRR